MGTKGKIIKISLIGALSLGIAAGLYFLLVFNLQLFRTVIEFASIALGTSIFLVVISTSSRVKNVFMLFLATTVFTALILDFINLLASRELGVISSLDAGTSRQLWVSARFLQVAGLFIAVFIINKVLSKKGVTIISVVFPAVFIILVLIIFIFKIFPGFSFSGNTLGLDLMVSGYVLSFIAVVSMILYLFKRKTIGNKNCILIILSLSFYIAGILAVILNLKSSLVVDSIGYLLKLGSIYCLYLFFIETNIRDPYKILLNNLKLKNDQLEFVSSHDSLTGFLNQETSLKAMKRQFEIAKRFDKKFSIIILDIDDFNDINYNYGHPEGDEVLKFTADIINHSVRDVDIKGRYGADEFIIAPLQLNSVGALSVAQKIQDSLNAASLPEGAQFRRFQISGGVSGIRAGRTFEDVLGKAEKALLKSKKLGKNRITLIR